LRAQLVDGSARAQRNRSNRRLPQPDQHGPWLPGGRSVRPPFTL